MHKRRLGPDGPMVSAIGLGAMSFAGIYGEASEAQSHEVLDAAREVGIDHLDTSNVYGAGRSESIVGAYLARQGKGARDIFTIATKGGITKDPATGARRFDNTKTHLTEELDGSLKRLGVECVDLYYVHRRDPSLPIEEVTETLAGFVKAGKTRAIGYSEIAPSSLRRAAAVHPVAAVQSEYSLGVRASELGLVRVCEELGTALVAFSPVGRGVLTDHPPTHEAIDAIDFFKGNPRFMEPNFSANEAYLRGFRALAAETGTNAAALANAWLLTRSSCVIPIPGTRSAAHLRELAAGGDMELSEADMARIEVVLPCGWAHGDRYSDSQWVGPERYS